jgi:hypothetical protein
MPASDSVHRIAEDRRRTRGRNHSTNMKQSPRLGSTRLQYPLPVSQEYRNFPPPDCRKAPASMPNFSWQPRYSSSHPTVFVSVPVVMQRDPRMHRIQR